jgi:hypothetical protein
VTSWQRATRRPFTVAFCRSCRAEPGLEVLEALRATIRRCDHGVLVVTECMLGVLTCRARVHGPGAIVLLQPCSTERVPNEAARWIGPINDQDDVCVVCDWVAGGEWDCHALPARLRAELRWTAGVGRRN